MSYEDNDSTQLVGRGKHLAIPRSIQFDRAGTDDKEQVVVQFEIVGENDAYAGWTITAFLFLTDKTFDRTVESLRHMGWQGDDLSELPALCDQGQLGEVEIVVDHEDYQGKTQAKVKWVNRKGGGAVQLKKPLEGQELATFAARMKGRVRAVGNGRQGGASAPSNGAGGGYRSSSPHPNAPGADDDIPF